MLEALKDWWGKSDTTQRAIRASWPSLKEIAFTLLISNIALLVLVVIWAFTSTPDQVNASGVIRIVRNTIQPSQALVYVMAILAAPLWLMFSRWRARRHVAFFSWMLAVQAFIVLVSSVVFSVDALHKLTNQALASQWALWCFISCLVIWFITLVYVKVWVDPAVGSASLGPTPTPGNSVLDKLRKHQGEQHAH